MVVFIITLIIICPSIISSYYIEEYGFFFFSFFWFFFLPKIHLCKVVYWWIGLNKEAHFSKNFDGKPKDMGILFANVVTNLTNMKAKILKPMGGFCILPKK